MLAYTRNMGHGQKLVILAMVIPPIGILTIGIQLNNMNPVNHWMTNPSIATETQVDLGTY